MTLYRVAIRVFDTDVQSPDGYWKFLGYHKGGRRYLRRRAEVVAYKANLAERYNRGPRFYAPEKSR